MGEVLLWLGILGGSVVLPATTSCLSLLQKGFLL